MKPEFDATDPAAYDWSALRRRSSTRAQPRGWKVLLTVSGPVPRWATNGAKDNVTRPSPNEFRMFVQAVATHFGGKVDALVRSGTSPTSRSSSRPSTPRAHSPLSPRIYRNLFLAAVRGLRNAGQGAKPVLIGETSPRGTGKVVAAADVPARRAVPGRQVPQGQEVREPCPRRLRAPRLHDAAGPALQPAAAQRRDDRRASRLTQRARARRGSAGATTRTLPIYLTEFGIQSHARPDARRQPAASRPSTARSPSASPTTTRASCRSRSTCCATTSPRRACRKVLRYPGFESGLRTLAGKAKPALRRLPPAARRAGAAAGKISLWGLVRPAGGATQATVEISANGRTWHTLSTYTTDARGYFTRTVSDAKNRQWRADVDGARRHRLPRQRHPRLQAASAER